MDWEIGRKRSSLDTDDRVSGISDSESSSDSGFSVESCGKGIPEDKY